jgi:hypothetical protein
MRQRKVQRGRRRGKIPVLEPAIGHVPGLSGRPDVKPGEEQNVESGTEEIRVR